MNDINNECPICLEYMDDTKDIGLLECGHKFHMDCIYSWYSKEGSNYKCPCCFIQRNIKTIIPKKIEPLKKLKKKINFGKKRESSKYSSKKKIKINIWKL